MDSEENNKRVVENSSEMGNQKRQKRNESESARGGGQLKNTNVLIAQLQTALIHERLKRGVVAHHEDKNSGSMDPMVIIAELQTVLTEETIQHRMQIEDERRKNQSMEARLAKMEQYKRRANEASDAVERASQLEQDLAKVLDENGEMERRLSIIIATATGEQEYDVAADTESTEHEEEIAVNPSPSSRHENRMETTLPSSNTSSENATATTSPSTDSSSLTDSQQLVTFEQENEQEEVSVASKPDSHENEGTGTVVIDPEKKQRLSNQNTWANEEMMTLYRLRHAVGSNDWASIAALEKIPKKNASDMAIKWNRARKRKKFNPLEKAFKDANAKVAKETEEETLVGTVTGYVMDTETREGTWDITWQDGTTEGVKKEGLLVALNVFGVHNPCQGMVVAETTVRWTGEEMMTLYLLRHAIGSNNWTKIAATGKIPNKSAHDMATKWTSANIAIAGNPLERAFKNAKAKVAKETGGGKLVGTVTNYKMIADTREGIWLVTYEDRSMEELKKAGLFAAMNLYNRLP